MGFQQFMNSFESRAFAIMQPIEPIHNCRFFPKVKLGDVLEIRKSGLDDDHFDYAVKAHFDFIVVKDNQVRFAIELDGPGHYRSDKTPERDKKKNFICEHFDFELLRIDLGYLNELSDSHVLRILLQDYFNRHSPKLNPKHSSGWQCLKTLWEENSAAELTLKQRDRVHEKTGKYECETQTFYAVENDFEYVAKVRQVAKNRYCIGHGSAHHSNIFSTNPLELAEDLSCIDLQRKISQYEEGKQRAKSSFEYKLVRSVYAAPGIFPKVRKLVLESYSNQ